MVEQTVNFDFLSPLPTRAVAELLGSVKPLLAAAILVRLPSTFMTKVLAHFPAEQRTSIFAERIAAKNISPELLKRAATALRERVENNQGQNFKATTTPAGPQPWQPRRLSQAEAAASPQPQPTPQPQVQLPKQRRQQSPATSPSQRLTDQLRQRQAREKKKPTPPPPPTPKHAEQKHAGQKIDGMAIAAEILKLTNPDLQRRIANAAPELYQGLRDRMYTFEDLEHTKSSDLALILNEVKSEVAALALRFAPRSLTGRALQAVSPRRADLIRDEIKRGGESKQRIRMGDIENAQNTLLEVALSLQAVGQILINPNDAEVP